MKALLVGALCVLVLVVPVVRDARAEITAEAVRKSIDLAVAYLKREQSKDGNWPDQPGMPGGITALCTLALLNAGVPADDPQIQSALAYLRRIKPKHTYMAALQTMVFAAAEPNRDGPMIQRNVKWLEDHQNRDGEHKGGWGYPDGPSDNSNTQFALLGLHEAQRAKASVTAQTWRLALDYFQRTQNSDGSWGYRQGMPGSGSMTSAGISAVYMALDKLSEGDATVHGEKIECCGQQEVDKSIDRALAWMGRNFSVVTNPGTGRSQTYLLYYLYGMERVGRLSNQRFIGRHDWYREGADFLVDKQDKLSGFWKGVGLAEDNPNIGTSFALLFLAKGRRPVIAAKLKHDPQDDWNHHRNDLANLTVYTEKKWKRDLTWQIIDIHDAGPDDLSEAPVQYISGELKPEFTDAEVKNLREYVNRGGFIFADACCGGEEFDRGFRELCQRIFPEPEYKLHLLPPEHAVWSIDVPVEPQVKPLWGIDFGCRTSVVYCPENLSCLWELARPGREREKKFPAPVQSQIDTALALGINMLAYATNREPKYKLDLPETAIAGGPQDLFDRAKLYVGKIKHTGGWNSAPRALHNLLAAISHEAGLRVSTDQREVSLSDDQLYQYPMLFMHGRNAFHFSDAERKRLKTFLERGGVLMADAVCTSDQFADSFRKEMGAIFPDHPLAKIPAGDPLFTSEFGGFDLKTVGRRDPQRRAAGAPLKASVRDVAPELEAVKLGQRYAVIFSPYDLSCALERHESLECPGYIREDAARIGINIVLYGLHQ
jgi:Domain of unknown function (DUF4159)/Squalene-hopene cyclase C-terminal domain